MYKIQTLNKISESGLSVLDRSKYQISDSCENPDAIIVRSQSMLEMELPGTLLAVARAGAGTNNIPIDKCSEKGIVVFNTPGANANAVKELVIAGLFMTSRRVWEGINWAQSLAGQTDVAKLVEKGKADFTGPEIMGKTLGVLGLGAIGVLVANACVALGMKVIGYDPFLSDKAKKTLSPDVKIAGLDEIYANSDYLSIHVPFNNDTKHMINAASIAKCKKGVRILNFARGELVDNAAVKSALENGSVTYYITDFPTEEVLGVKGLITVPHLGASTPESEENCAVMASNQIKEFLEKGNIINSVNFPNVESAFQAPNRICVTGKYNDEIESAVSAVVKRCGIKAPTFVNLSRNGCYYAIIDVAEGDLGGAVSGLKEIGGVLCVRVLGR